MRKHSIVLCGLLLGLGGCVGDRLGVENLNSPDVARAFGTADGIEGVIVGLAPQLNNPQRASESVNTQSKIFAAETFATVANFGMAQRASIPRAPIDNDLGNNIATGNLANFNNLQRIARQAVNGIQAVDALVASTAGFGLGSPARNTRAKAFAFLILGQAMGYVSFAHDSGALITPSMALGPADPVPSLASAKALNAAAVAMLDSAIILASSPAATQGQSVWPLPTNWISGISMTQDGFIRLAKSYRARIRAGVARTPAERAAVDWTKIIDDATNGITEDHNVMVKGSSGWSAAFDVGQMYVVGGWHSAPMYYYGMADTSGRYAAWLQTPRDDRRQFTVATPDKRWPRGATRAAQQAGQTNNILPEGQYFRNRPSGSDVLGASWGESEYDHRRYGRTQASSAEGPYTDMSATEISMLAAEGYLRASNFGAAMTLINASRVRNNLAPISGITSLTQPIGTGAGCIPQVPQAPNFTTTSCGNIWEAMKYEKRMETAFTGYMVWFTDSRGWGDLIATTPLEWPVPYQEMNARQQPFYNGNTAAPVGTYGFQ